ncbi:hypothetical protein J1N10_07675 [Carboxylicivirga sp. A043]|uniref:hypothetical protein n=1 Tax=Carboxylicivirga litoralis TaxID=2816963 RepID=UPI0021CB5F15|nr:hypothetical protein [Carboxylicivirga sp. A043]MCU4155853.1 hypothetical protein [Carboxylicivirga sp. A043]
MFKNKLYTIGATILLGLVALVACQEDPEFPDPGFEISDKRVELRRDTIDTYHVEFQMSVPNGIDKIQVLNGNDYSLIEQVDEYNGQTKCLFEYDIDLTPFEKDTTLNYIIRAVDNYERSINKGLTLIVNKKSTPTIQVVGGENVAVSLPAYLAKALVTTGLAPIETISVRYEGNEVETITIPADTAVYEYKLKQQVIVGTLEENREYSVEIEVMDKGFEYTTASGEVITREPLSYTSTITLTKGSDERQIPSMVTYSDSYRSTPYRILFFANGDAQIDSIGYQTYSTFRREWNDPLDAMVLTYNAQNMVDTVKFGRYDDKRVLTYVDGTTMLDKIEYWEDINATPGDVQADDITLEASNFSYNELNQMVSYFSESSSYMVNDLRYIDPFGIGEYVGIEEFFDGPEVSADPADRAYFDTFAPVYTPAYIPGLPACVELKGGSIFEEAVKILCTNNYLALELKDAAGEIDREFTYTVDEQGRITLITWEYEYLSSTYIKSYTCSYD